MASVFYNIFNDDLVKSIQSSKTVISKLIEFAEKNNISGNLWHEYLCRKIAQDDNVLAKMVDGYGKVGESLTQLALNDMSEIQKLFTISIDPLLENYISTNPLKVTPFTISVERICNALKQDVKAAYDALIQHYKELGHGCASKCIAYFWDNGLKGIENVDDITFDHLIGYERQKEIIIHNTSLFIQGKGGNNVLLFGDSGTGKSSSVKAVLNMFCNQRLRLVEFHKHQLQLLPQLLEDLSTRGQKYIVFMDDLSFEENEVGYKYLKAVLSGTTSAALSNVLYYVTSNRRHLIREVWADRVREDEEVHISDTVHEKLSLADRFGVSIHFSSLVQDEFITMVEKLCQMKNINFTDDIRKNALMWTANKSRSGRTAKQFVDSLG